MAPASWRALALCTTPICRSAAGQRVIEERDDAPLVLGGRLADGRRVAHVGQVPDVDGPGVVPEVTATVANSSAANGVIAVTPMMRWVSSNEPAYVPSATTAFSSLPSPATWMRTSAPVE